MRQLPYGVITTGTFSLRYLPSRGCPLLLKAPQPRSGVVRGHSADKAKNTLRAALKSNGTVFLRSISLDCPRQRNYTSK